MAVRLHLVALSTNRYVVMSLPFALLLMGAEPAGLAGQLNPEPVHSTPLPALGCPERAQVAPLDPQAPACARAVIENLRLGGIQDQAAEKFEQFLRDYAESSDWWRANDMDLRVSDAAMESLEASLRILATNWHNQARKIKKADGLAAATVLYVLAERAYATYMIGFPDSRYAYDVQYAYAELLYDVQKFDEAYATYQRVVDDGPDLPHGKFCADSQMFAAIEMVKREKVAAGPDPSQQALSPWEVKELAAMDQFLHHYPSDPKARNVAYRAGYLLNEYGQYLDASRRLRVAILLDPSAVEAEQAANVVLDGLVAAGEWEALVQIAGEFRRVRNLGSAEFRRHLRRTLREARTRAEGLIGAG